MDSTDEPGIVKKSKRNFLTRRLEIQKSLEKEGQIITPVTCSDYTWDFQKYEEIINNYENYSEYRRKMEVLYGLEDFDKKTKGLFK